MGLSSFVGDEVTGMSLTTLAPSVKAVILIWESAGLAQEAGTAVAISSAQSPIAIVLEMEQAGEGRAETDTCMFDLPDC